MALKVFHNSYSPFLLGVQFCFPFVNTKFVVSNANYSLLLENLSRKTNMLVKYNNCKATCGCYDGCIKLQLFCGDPLQ